MGIFGGIVDVAKNVGKFATAPLKGAAKVVGTGLETGLKVTGDLLTLQPGKAIDDLGKGIHKQVDNVIGIPKDEWSAVNGAAGGLGETLTSGAKFVGEPIRGVARVAANNISTVGNAATHALTGNFGASVQDVVGGVQNNFSIAGDTVKNQFNNAF